MATFSHSGTTGDTFCSLVAAKILGGGEFYLKLHNLENMLKEKLGWSVKGGRHDGLIDVLIVSLRGIGPSLYSGDPCVTSFSRDGVICAVGIIEVIGHFLVFLKGGCELVGVGLNVLTLDVAEPVVSDVCYVVKACEVG